MITIDLNPKSGTSQHHSRELAGNFSGDFIKGSLWKSYPPGISQGILLHRKIDDFIDHHPVAIQSKRRLGNRFPHLNGIIVDLYYDHFLALHWPQFHPLPLPEYAAWVYASIKPYLNQLPEGVDYVLEHMEKGNWLCGYAERAGMESTFRGMSRRVSSGEVLLQAAEVLFAEHNSFEADFFAFMPDALALRL